MKLPCEECGGRCCTPPAMNKRDALRIERYTKHKTLGGENFYMLDNSWDKEDNLLPVCPAFDEEKKNCSIYPFRPTVCRKYALIKELPCLYLYPEEAEKFINGEMQPFIRKVIEDLK